MDADGVDVDLDDLAGRRRDCAVLNHADHALCNLRRIVQHRSWLAARHQLRVILVGAVGKHLKDQFQSGSFACADERGVRQHNKIQVWVNCLDGGSDDVDDDLFEAAKEEVMRAGKASASLLQRRLRVGYARAARLLDILEDHGIIGPGDGAKPREVYGAVSSEEKAEYGQDEENI